MQCVEFYVSAIYGASSILLGQAIAIEQTASMLRYDAALVCANACRIIRVCGGRAILVFCAYRGAACVRDSVWIVSDMLSCFPIFAAVGSDASAVQKCESLVPRVATRYRGRSYCCAAYHRRRRACTTPASIRCRWCFTCSGFWLLIHCVVASISRERC
jgi:hypothetical protein